MSESTGGRPPGEPDASKISPLLGTNRVQSAVDSMARAADKVAGGLTKAADVLQKMSTAASRATGTAGMGNGATLNGGRANGGGSTPVIGQRLGGGIPLGMPSHQHAPTMTQMYGAPPSAFGRGNPWAKRGAMLGSMWGAASAARAMGDAQDYIATNTTAQLMGRGIPMHWDDVRRGIMRNNYTATSDLDAAAGALTARKSGFRVGSSGFNSLMDAGKNYRVMDPTATFAQAQARLTAPMGATQGNFLLSRGIRTTDGNGRSRSAMSVYNDILTKSGFSGTHKYTADAKEAHFGATGNATNLMGRLAEVDPDMARGTEDLLRNSMTAQEHGFTRAQYMAAAQTGNWNALKPMGIEKTDLDRTKDIGALNRNLRDNKAEGFSDGLNASVTALEQFKGALDKITDGPFGRMLGIGGGMAGASGIAGTIGHVGSSALGGYIGGKVFGSVLGGGTARAGLAAAGRGVAGSALGAAGIVGSGVAALGAAAISASTSDVERARRKAQMMQHGASDSWMTNVNAWADSFNNDMTLGLSDRWGMGNSNNYEHKGPDGTGGETGMGVGGVSGVGGASTDGTSPVGNAKVTAPFGKYPNSGKPHYGVDFGVKIGTPVKAARGGRVYQAGWDTGGFGNHVRIDAGGELYFIYGHLSRVNVRVGQTVTAGQVLGLSGDTGNSTGAHLHFEVRKGGKGLGHAVNPSPYLHGVLGAAGAGSTGSAEGESHAKGRDMTPAVGSSMDTPWGVNESDLITGALASSGSSGPTASRGSSPEGDAGASSAGIPSGSMSGILSKAGFRGHGLSLAYAIMMAESRGNPKAHNQNRNTGDNSYGLFQINMLGGMGPERRSRWHLRNNDELFNPSTNAKVAYDMSKGGTDWHDWSTYKSGSYKKYLGGNVKSYDVGSTNVDVDQVARVHKGEMIIDPVTADELRKALSSNSPTSVFGGGKGGGRAITVGKIEIHTAHPYTDSAATDLGKQFLAIIGNHEQIQMIQEG